MAEQSNLNSQLQPADGNSYSELQSLIRMALRRYGDMSAGTLEGDVSLMFLEFANEIIEDIRQHPYWGGGDLHYYKSVEERREIPDIIVLHGLMFKYAIQQESAKVKSLGPQYFRTLNGVLYNRRFGSQDINLKVVDDGSDPNRRGVFTPPARS
jgi:hypothetical protein